MALSPKLQTTLIIVWGLFLEFPIRYMVCPDPWLQSVEHWYFAQPSRLLIEIGFAVLALLPFFWQKDLKTLLKVSWKKDNILFLFLGILGSILIFTTQQWEEIVLIKNNDIRHYLPIWLATGMVIGISQELTFRGLLYTGLEKKYGTSTAVILSTLCFVLGAIHSVRLYAYLSHGHVVTTLILLTIFALSGLFFVWIRISTKTIIIPAIIHGVGNAITWSTFVLVKLYG